MDYISDMNSSNKLFSYSLTQGGGTTKTAVRLRMLLSPSIISLCQTALARHLFSFLVLFLKMESYSTLLSLILKERQEGKGTII